MEGSYSVGDAVLIKKFANSFGTGDVIFFEYPVQDTLGTRTIFAQRIYGVGGDSVFIQGKLVYVNGQLVTQPSELKYNYFVKTRKVVLDSAFLAKYQLYEGGRVSDAFDYSYGLTVLQADSLKKDSLIASVQLKLEKQLAYDETCFPGNPHFKWNMDHYGPLYIPRQNDTLRLDTFNIKLYGNLISESEKNKLELHHDTIVINGVATSFYVVKKNYFFVLGDNRDNANDSRIWGFLPENAILGKVVYTLRKTK